MDLSFYTKHSFLFLLCKSSIPHTQNVDNVDNFVYNFNLRDFLKVIHVDRMCMTLSTYPTFRHSLCNLSNPLFYASYGWTNEHSSKTLLTTYYCLQLKQVTYPFHLNRHIKSLIYRYSNIRVSSKRGFYIITIISYYSMTVPIAAGGS